MVPSWFKNSRSSSKVIAVTGSLLVESDDPLELLSELPEVLFEPFVAEPPLVAEPPFVAEPPLVAEPPVVLELPVVVVDGPVLLLAALELAPLPPVVFDELVLFVAPVGPVVVPEVSDVPDEVSVPGLSTGLPQAETSAAQKVSNRGRVGKSVLMVEVDRR